MLSVSVAEIAAPIVAAVCTVVAANVSVMLRIAVLFANTGGALVLFVPLRFVNAAASLPAASCTGFDVGTV